MKKIRLYIFGCILMFVMILGVDAQEIRTVADFNYCIRDNNETQCILMDNITVTNSAYITDTKEIDLNNKTLTATNKIYVHRGANVVIKNGVIHSSSSVGVTVRSNSKLKLENTTIDLNSSGGKALYIIGEKGFTTDVTVDHNSKITGNYGIVIDGSGTNKDASGVKLDFYGSVKGINTDYSGGIALTINGLVTETTGDVPVINVNEGAVIEATGGTAVYGAGYEIWNFNGGSVTGDSALSIKSGVFHISGGTYRATGEYIETPVESSGVVTKTGSAISITYNENYAGGVELDISNANVISDQGYALYEENLGKQSAVKDIAITGGTFHGDKGAVSIASVDNEIFDGFITSGTFNSLVSDTFVNDSYVQKEFNGKFIVGKSRDVIVEDIENGNIIVSKNKAIQGEDVEVKVECREGYYLEKVVVVDSNGNDVEINHYKFVMPNSDVTVSAILTKNPNNGEVNNPKTSDNIVVQMVSLIVSLLVFAMIMLFKRKFKINVL